MWNRHLLVPRKKFMVILLVGRLMLVMRVMGLRWGWELVGVLVGELNWIPRRGMLLSRVENVVKKVRSGRRRATIDIIILFVWVGREEGL
jgi:hypothetical protein